MSSAVARAAGRSERWLRARLLSPPHPLMVVEVRARSLGVVRLRREGRRLALGAAASLELPEGVLRLSMTEPNVLQPEAFEQALRAVLERAGALGAGRVGLVLPDPVARIALLPAAEAPGRGRESSEDVIRFRLRKSVPFDIREARLAFAAPAARAADPVVVAAIFGPVLEAYERACRAVGMHPGLVELAGLALLRAAFGGLPPADRMLVNWDAGYVTLLLARGDWPLLVRTLTGAPADDPAEVAREISHTVIYHRERLGGGALAQAVLRSAILPAREAAAALEPALGLRPDILEPFAALHGAGVSEEAAQAVAGAAACLAGSPA